MNPLPPWKRWLSYLGEIQLESISSNVNPDLRISLVRGRLQLSSTNSIYSFDDYYLNFLTAFQKLQIERQSISNVLMLGLGLGSVPFILEKKFRLFLEYTIVDFDETVIYLASKYALPRIQSPVQIVHADAWSYVRLNGGKTYDMIVVDLFVDDVVPSVFESIDFLNCLTRMSHHQTLILSNRLYRTGMDKQKTDRYYKEIFQQVFESSEHMLIEGNSILKARVTKKPQYP